MRKACQVAEGEFCRSALCAASDVIVATDLNAVITRVNPAFEVVTGYRTDEVVGKNVGHVLGTPYNTVIYPAMWKTLLDTGHWEGEFINRRKNGEEWIAEEKISLVLDSNGLPLGYVSVARDVTEQRRAEDQLKHYVRSLEQARAELEEGLVASTFALAHACEYREQGTGQHLRRLQALSQAVAERLGYAPRQAERLGLAAVLHDIGKIGVPDAILTKPGPLTEEEWVIVREHPRMGLGILPALPQFQMAREVVYGHHENFDGSGYPEGLKGTDIPLPARVVRVVDTFDAIVSERPYKPSRPPEDALKELGRLAGKQFCPVVVSAFKELWEDGTLERILAGQEQRTSHRSPTATAEPVPA